MQRRGNYASINNDEEVIKIKEEYSEPNFLELFANEGEKQLSEILESPNIPVEITKPEIIIGRMMEIVNKKKKKVTMVGRNTYFGTKYISPTQIGVVQHASSGQLEIIPPGRWISFNPYVKWRGIFNISDDIIKVDYLTIVNVSTGNYGICTNNSYPFLMAPGRHVKMSGVYKFMRQVPQNSEHIQHGVVHVCQVGKGQFGKILENFIPRLLPPGRHVFISSRFTYSGSASASQDLIKHGTITRFRVNNGQVVLAWEDQQPVFFTEPGVYERDSANFSIVRFVETSNKYYALGSRKIITVNMGEIAITYRDGKLMILKPGRHSIDHPNHIFQAFLSTQQKTLDLSSRSRGQYLECETKDLVKVGLKAILIYKIQEPEKSLLEIGDQTKIEPLLLDTAIATLNGIIRSTTLTEVARASEDPKRLKQAEKNEQNLEVPSAPLFFQRAHDEFLFKLHDRFLGDYGINIVDLRIESFKIIEEELASQISRQAILTAKTQTELANLEGKNQIETQDQNRKAQVQAIENRMNADRIQMETDAKNRSIISKAETKAKEIKIVAEAEAEARIIAANADLEYIKRMNSTELGKEMALLRMKTEMVRDALKGTEKIVFVDSNNPLGFFKQLMDTIPEMGKMMGSLQQKKE